MTDRRRDEGDGAEAHAEAHAAHRGEAHDGPRDGPQKPPGYKLPQVVLEGVLRQGRNSDVITFKFRVLRILELTFLVVVPEAGKTRAPVYVRMWVDAAGADKPGTVAVGD